MNHVILIKIPQNCCISVEKTGLNFSVSQKKFNETKAKLHDAVFANIFSILFNSIFRKYRLKNLFFFRRSFRKNELFFYVSPTIFLWKTSQSPKIPSMEKFFASSYYFFHFSTWNYRATNFPKTKNWVTSIFVQVG